MFGWQSYVFFTFYLLVRLLSCYTSIIQSSLVSKALLSLVELLPLSRVLPRSLFPTYSHQQIYPGRIDHVANIHNSFASFIRHLPVYIIIMPLIRNGSGTGEENEHDGGGGMIAATSASFQDDCQTKLAAQEGVSQEVYPRWITQKFEPDGRLLPFPGSTIICPLSPESALHRALLRLSSDLQGTGFASLYAMLPPTSWHMTIFEGVSDKIRKPGLWPESLALYAPLESCTTLFKQKLRDFDLRTEPPFRMAVYGFEPLEDGIALRVVPASPSEERRLRQLRDRLSTLLGTRYPGHDHYSFHVSVSYMLRYLNKQQHKDIWTFLQGYISNMPEYFELGAPEFCTFDDMFAFRREFYLETQS